MKKLCIKTSLASYTLEELSESDRALILEAKEMTKKSYSPYSHFQVGAAALLADGTIIKGSNQENAAYPSGLCAERTTLFAANANYPNVPVVALAIACFTQGHFTANPGTPCGSCRQVMLETEHRFNTPMRVLLYGENEIYVFEKAADLLPFGFFAEDLKGN
ncbi:MAG: cytidine deaminase [Paludibacteraceae bacterium]|nr:cytidine deaminase [Paludibacteraceae bacterium]